MKNIIGNIPFLSKKTGSVGQPYTLDVSSSVTQSPMYKIRKISEPPLGFTLTQAQRDISSVDPATGQISLRRPVPAGLSRQMIVETNYGPSDSVESEILLQGRSFVSRFTPYKANPPLPSQNVIVVDLNEYDPTLTIPVWDGSAPTQSLANDYANRYPADRDVLIIGHRTQPWTGAVRVHGGRIVHWIGGKYVGNFPIINRCWHTGIFEGIYAEYPFDPNVVTYSGDGLTIRAEATKPGVCSSYMLGNHIYGVDGFTNGGHGDLFQVQAGVTSGTNISSVFKDITIERFRGWSAHQLFFLCQQHFGESDVNLLPDYLSLRDIHLIQLRDATYAEGGSIEGQVKKDAPYLWTIDPQATASGTASNGEKPYPKIFDGVWIEPIIAGTRGHIRPLTGTNEVGVIMDPIHDLSDIVTFDPTQLITGNVRYGKPDILRDNNGIGGMGIPGMNYKSPGYNNISTTPYPVYTTPYTPDIYQETSSMRGLVYALDPDQEVGRVVDSGTITSIQDRKTGIVFSQDGSSTLPALSSVAQSQKSYLF